VDFARILNNFVHYDTVVDICEFEGRLKQIVNPVLSFAQVLVLALNLNANLRLPAHVLKPVGFSDSHEHL